MKYTHFQRNIGLMIFKNKKRVCLIKNIGYIHISEALAYSLFYYSSKVMVSDGRTCPKETCHGTVFCETIFVLIDFWPLPATESFG